MSQSNSDGPNDRKISNRTLGWLLALGVLIWFLIGIVWIYIF